ncbi:hypothetical protein D3877_10235 [Azospirillum cavernae]|uniref:Uncharacterized protein n=1 Tax=Azospirillum cavernae TaxID=2320860 RepID=A0A418W4H4_9PROT|nr:hypothetical protein [Azospirillum cavernae]RJF84847.1 hypothetical protein D3877_10235 [Azospirillum cavernae]
MSADTIQAALFGAFGLSPPSRPPDPAPADRFPTFTRPAAPPVALNPLRLAVGGTVTHSPKR